MFTAIKNFFTALDNKATSMVITSIGMIRNRKSFMDIVKASAYRFGGFMLNPASLIIAGIYSISIGIVPAVICTAVAAGFMAPVSIIVDLFRIPAKA